jgi:hypothetical protein
VQRSAALRSSAVAVAWERIGEGAVWVCDPAKAVRAMNQVIYLVGLIVVILAILSFLGLR